jgi:hypothetical protein
MHAADLGEALRRIQIEFTDWPTLSLTRVQAQRLWNLPGDVCDTALAYLVDIEFLRHVDGVFARRELDRGRFGIRQGWVQPPQAA